jgi:hypothetical protein
MIKCLTVYQPWSSLIALGEKTIETRSWYTRYRGPLLIHAASKFTHETYMGICATHPFWGALQTDEWRTGNVPVGRILAICNLVDCVEINGEFFTDSISEKERAFGDYTLGRFVWRLDDVRQLKEPIPARGLQRLWNFDETPHLVSIDPYSISETKIWTPKGVISGRKLDKPDEDALQGLEVA